DKRLWQRNEGTMRTPRPDLRSALRRLLKITAFTSITALTMASVLDANPAADYQQPENPPWRATVEEERRGRELLARVIASMGGSRIIDGLASYSDVHKATVKLPQGDQEVAGHWMIEFIRSREGARLPDRAREEVTADGPQGARLTVRVFAPG